MQGDEVSRKLEPIARQYRAGCARRLEGFDSIQQLLVDHHAEVEGLLVRLGVERSLIGEVDLLRHRHHALDDESLTNLQRHARAKARHALDGSKAWRYHVARIRALGQHDSRTSGRVVRHSQVRCLEQFERNRKRGGAVVSVVLHAAHFGRDRHGRRLPPAADRFRA